MENKKSGLKIAINGFGRIGRAAFKIILERNNGTSVLAINDLTDTKTLAHLLKYDSCYGKFKHDVKADDKNLIIDGVKYPVYAIKDPKELPWKDLGVDIVIECTGRFTDKDSASAHILAGAKKVVISAPAKGADVKTYVLGVNEETMTKGETVISNASCTTNCLAPVTAIIKEAFGIKKAIMSTVHSYTADQNLVDGPHKDLRRARAAALNIVPTTTGAAKAVTETIPTLKGKFDGLALRVPTPVGSLCDVTFVLNKQTTKEEVNKVLKAAAKTARFKKIVAVSEEPLVSTDIVGTETSTVVDLSLTNVIEGDLLKIIAWYDNEWGYSNRLVDICVYAWKKKLI